MTSIRYRKLTTWPHKETSSRDRQKARFQAGYAATLTQLEGEIAKLNGTDIVVQGFIHPNNLRRDGWPLEKSPADKPGIIVSFHAGKLGELVYADDQYSDWKDNLRGIALTLEALRAVRRYGAVHEDEQYKGFSTEIAPRPAPVVPQSKLLAAEILIELSRETKQNAALVAVDATIRDALYRIAARLSHPDRGGSAEQFRRLQTAMEALRS